MMALRKQPLDARGELAALSQICGPAKMKNLPLRNHLFFRLSEDILNRFDCLGGLKDRDPEIYGNRAGLSTDDGYVATWQRVPRCDTTSLRLS